MKPVSAMLRHSNIKSTVGIYSYAVCPNRLPAQGQFLGRLLTRERSHNQTWFQS